MLLTIASMVAVKTALFNWLLMPQTLTAIAVFLIGLPSTIEQARKAKEGKFWDMALEVAKIEALKVAKMNLSEDDKLERTIGAIVAVMPKEAEKYKHLLEEVAKTAYHTYVKPKLKEDKALNE